MTEKQNLPHIVIIGAGFGGLRAARALRNKPVSVTLIDRNNYNIAFVVVRSSLLPKALQRWPNAIVISGSLESLTTTRSQN